MKFTSAKEAIHDSYNYSLMQNVKDTDPTARIQFTAKGGAGAVWLQFEASSISRIVKGLPQLLRFWAEFAYADLGLRPKTRDISEAQGFNLSARGFNYLVMSVALAARREHRKQDITPLEMPRWTALAELCVKEMAAREWLRFEDASLAEKSAAVKVAPSEFEYVWGQRYASMQNICNKFSARSLGPVAARLVEASAEGDAA